MSDLWSKISHEPAVIIGAIASIVLAVYQVQTGDLTFEAAIPVIAAAVIRFFVSPAGEQPANGGE